MNSVLIFLGLVACVLSSPVVKSQGSANMRKVGQVGSKTFFEQIKKEKTGWIEARKICAEENLEMGITANEAEFRYLYNTHTKTDYRISGAQKGLRAELNSSGSTLNTFELEDGSEVPADINFNQASATWLCLYNTGEDHTFVDNCLSGRHHVLCQKTT